MIHGAETAGIERGEPEGGSLHPDGRVGETPHAFLRRVTRPWHDRVEAAFEAFDLRTRDGLSGFLARQSAALLPLERALERAGVAELLADWPARRRAPALAADLAQLGAETPPWVEPPECPTPCHMLGILYVIEGSKLGGRVLHRRVLASPDPQVRAATRFLGHHHERGWSGFLAVLDAAPPAAQAWADLREGAWAAFAAFDAAARLDIVPRFADAPARSSLYDQAHA